MNLSYNSNVDTTYSLTGISAFFAIFMFVFSIVATVIVLCSWAEYFKRKSKPLIAAFIPVYREIVLTQIAKEPLLYALLLCLPIVNIYAMYVIYKKIAEEYNKQIGFVLGMIILPFIFVPILVFKNDNPVIVDYFKEDEEIIEEIEDENSL